VIVVTLECLPDSPDAGCDGTRVLNQAFQATYEGRMFLAEVLLGIVAPVVLLIIPVSAAATLVCLSPRSWWFWDSL
jgi:hypothetical protein